MSASNNGKVMQAVNEMVRLYSAVSQLRSEIGPAGERQFQLLAEGPLAEIRQLQEQIELYLRHDDVALWAKVDGPAVEWRNASLSAIVTILQSIQKSFQGVAFSTATLREYPKREIRRASELRVVSLQPGSLTVGLRLPENLEGKKPARRPYPNLTNVVKLYMEVAKWAAAGERNERIEEVLPDPVERAEVLAEFERIIPNEPKGVEFVEITSPKYESPPVRLTFASREKIDEILVQLPQQKKLPKGAESVLAEISGRVREINLDTRTFILRERRSLGEVICSFELKLMDMIRPILDRDVKVSGAFVRAGTGKRSFLVKKVIHLDDRLKALPPKHQ